MAHGGDGKENLVRSRATRATALQYIPEKHCILCLNETTARGNLKRDYSSRGGVVYIKSLQVKAALQVQALRRSDEWGNSVMTRLQTVFDAKMVMKMRYHRNCYKSFYSSSRSGVFSPPPDTTPASSSLTGTPTPSPPAQRPRLSPSAAVPTPFKTPGRPRRASLDAAGTPLLPLSSNQRTGAGRPVDLCKLEAFNKLCAYLEANKNQQYSLDTLMALLSRYQPASQYSEKTLLRKLTEKYGQQITVATASKGKAVVTFTGQAMQLLRSVHATDKTDRGKLDAAIKVLSRDIANVPNNSAHFPTPHDIAAGGKSLIPESLLYVLSEIVKHRKEGNPELYERKCIAIANNIIAATRPRSFLSPLHLGLAVHLHRAYGSKELVSLLNQLGSCASYREALHFEDAVVFAPPARIDPNGFLQFSFDNVDYNVRTIDGLGTWHCLGGVISVTPASAVGLDPVLPARSSGVHSAAARAVHGTIPVQMSRYAKNQGLKTVLVPDYSEDVSSLMTTVNAARCMDFLWLLGSAFRAAPSPGWSGFMEVCTRGLPYEVSAVHPLPFINLDPTNPNALYTSLQFAIQEANKHGQTHCFVTFDQPLFWKAADIVLQSEPESPLRKVFPRLGGFHFAMSFIGCVGYAMAGSGIEVVWEVVYAKNTVPHMLSGHAYARAVRAHNLTQVVVIKLLVETFKEYFASRGVNTHQIIKDFEERLEGAAGGTGDVSVRNFLTALDEIESEADLGRTAKLWLLYVRLIEYLHFFIRGERSGDWDMHIAAVKLMLPAFSAAGHLNYAKSTPLYLKIAESLKEKLNQEEYSAFIANFAIRRSEKFFAGLSSDLTIEQVLMASLKGQGGVTRRGMTDATVATFVKTMPLCTRVTRALKHFAGSLNSETQPHTDLRESRKRRDYADRGKMYEWLRAHSPFTKPAEQLVSISTGVVGDETVNSDSMLQVGQRLVQSMRGKNFGEVTMKRNDRVIPLAAMSSSIKINNCVEPISESQLFHRIIALSLSDEELSECFQYELAPRPTSLFDQIGLRKGSKSALVKALDQLTPPDSAVPENPCFVFDGGYLLHFVVWPRPASFGEIANAYTTFIRSFTSRFQGTAAVVFDGYMSGPSTKDAEHARRSTRTAADIVVEENTPFASGSQGLFLMNSTNKEGLIRLLTRKFRAAGIEVSQAAADADRDIVRSALSVAEAGGNAVIVGEDTDLVVLMVALTPADKDMHIMTSSQARGTTVRHCSKLRAALGPTSAHILFLHSITGCDTTSFPYRKSKKIALGKLNASEELQEDARVFYQTGASFQEIAAAGKNFIKHYYGFPKADTLDKARFQCYKRSIVRQPVHAKFELATLPPSSEAAAQHSARTYHQVQAWLGNDLDPTQWGWELRGDRLVPVLSLQPAAPARLLKLIVCNCRGACANNNCECRRSGLQCSSLCGHCNGISCSNAGASLEESDNDVDDPDPTIPE